MQHYLITGGAGFIGNQLIRTLFRLNPFIKITNIDNFDNFYSREIKEKNIEGFDLEPALFIDPQGYFINTSR
ncbi:MAG: hypothetical protein QM764_16880 [Chitinophagaceae bacterium]